MTFEVDLLDGSGIAAVEITSAADSARLRASARADRYLSGLTVPGSQIRWLVQYTPQADARELSRSSIVNGVPIDQCVHDAGEAIRDIVQRLTGLRLGKAVDAMDADDDLAEEDAAPDSV